MAGCEILGTKSRVLRNLGECGWTDLFAVVETECEVGPTGSLQFPMGTNLFLERPAKAHQGRIYSLGLGGAPSAHAANRTFSGAGTSSPLSIMSAST